MSDADEKPQARGGDMDAPERIWANVAAWSNGQALAGEWNHRDVGSPDDTPYIRADLAAPVRVKPLVWAKSKTTNWNDDWHTVPTGYTVRCADENGWKWATPLGSFGYASSPNGAKQAAQLDHEARTRWALEPAPDLAELVEALETARDYVHDASRGALRYRSKADISNMAGEDLVMSDAKPDWENFSKAVLADWPTGDLEGSVLFDLSLQYGMIKEVPGGYNSDHHFDNDGICPEEGDPWYEYTFGGEAGPGLYSIAEMKNTIAALTAQNREMALDVLASSGQAQEAYAAQLAAEAEAAALRAKLARLEGAAKRVLAPLDEPCRHDHHGYCQAHFIEAECSVAELRAALTDGAADE